MKTSQGGSVWGVDVRKWVVGGSIAWVVGGWGGELWADFGRLRGSVELRNGTAVLLSEPPGWHATRLQLHLGFFAAEQISVQFILGQDLAVFSGQHPNAEVLGRRTFEFSPGARWWVLPRYRFSPVVDVHFSLPVYLNKNGGTKNRLDTSQGLRYSVGAVYDWSDGWGGSASLSMIHFFGDKFVALGEFSIGLVRIF